MGTDPAIDITAWLRQARRGDQAAAEGVYAEVYAELKRVAAEVMRGQAKSQTLCPTALVHEAYLRLVKAAEFEDRVHFFASAAKAMRHVLVDHAKRRKRAKRGGGWHRLTLVDGLMAGPAAEPGILDLEEALVRLEQLDPRQARIVELRFYGGLTVEETAHCLGLGKTTVDSDWRMARAWLRRKLAGH